MIRQLRTAARLYHQYSSPLEPCIKPPMPSPYHPLQRMSNSPGISSYSIIFLRLRITCSSILTSLNRSQYSLCSANPSSHLSLFLCVGHPQSGQSNAGRTRSPPCFSNEVGHRDAALMRSAFWTRAGWGEAERGVMVDDVEGDAAESQEKNGRVCGVYEGRRGRWRVSVRAALIGGLILQVDNVTEMQGTQTKDQKIRYQGKSSCLKVGDLCRTRNLFIMYICQLPEEVGTVDSDA